MNNSTLPKGMREALEKYRRFKKSFSAEKPSKTAAGTNLVPKH
jgi:hypothetical protein